MTEADALTVRQDSYEADFDYKVYTALQLSLT